MVKNRNDKAARLFGVWLGIVSLWPAQALAQAAPDGGGVTFPGSSGQTCVQVQIAGQKPSAYSCLNQELQQQVQGASRALPSPPLTATSPPNQVGIFNKQGVAQQYGPNFGKSVIPYRPAAPNFNN